MVIKALLGVGILLLIAMPALANSVNITIADESSGEIDYNLHLYFQNQTDVKYVPLTAYRDIASHCLWDENETAACISASANSGGASDTKYISTIQAFDYSNATFKLRWGSDESGSGTSEAYIRIYADGVPVFYEYRSDCDIGGTNDIYYFTINNSELQTSQRKAINLTIELYAYGGSATCAAWAYELRQINNTLNYTYVSSQINDRTIKYTSNTEAMGEIINYTAIFSGEMTYDDGSHYYNRIFQGTLNTSENSTLTFYHPSFAHLTTIYVKTGDMYLQNATITLSALINGTWTEVSKQRTGADGSAVILTSSNRLYIIKVEHPSYSNTLQQQFIFNPLQTTMYINMLQAYNITTPTINSWNIENVTTLWLPKNNIIYWDNLTKSVNLTYLDLDNLTNKIWLNVTYRINHTQNAQQYAYYESYGNSAFFSTILNTSPASYEFALCINRTTNASINSTAEYCTKRKYIYSQTHGIGAWNAEQSEELGGLSVITWQLIVFLAIAIATAICMKYMSIGAIIILPIGIIVATLLGIFPFDATGGFLALLAILLALAMLKVAR